MSDGWGPGHAADSPRSSPAANELEQEMRSCEWRQEAPLHLSRGTAEGRAVRATLPHLAKMTADGSLRPTGRGNVWNPTNQTCWFRVPASCRVAPAGDGISRRSVSAGGNDHMPEPTSPSELPDSADLDPEQLGHPRGTLVIVVIFGVLFGLAWLAMY